MAALLCALPLAAGTIDVYRAPAAALNSGDYLNLVFSGATFSAQANALGVSPYPTQLTFCLISAPAGAPGEFQADLESLDGSVSEPFAGLLSWSSGQIQSAAYTGPVSAVYGTFYLPEAVSQQIFSGTASGFEASLVFQYTGPPVAIGIPGRELGQDVTVSLGGGGINVGAMNTGLTLTGASSGPDSSPPGFASAPEPESAAMCMLAGGILWGVSTALKRFVRGRIQ